MKKRREKKTNIDGIFVNLLSILPLLGADHRLPILYTAKILLWINKTSDHINESVIGYMINPTLHVDKYFKEQVEKCMNNTFGSLTQPFIKTL